MLLIGRMKDAASCIFLVGTMQMILMIGGHLKMIDASLRCQVNSPSVV